MSSIWPATATAGDWVAFKLTYFHCKFCKVILGRICNLERNAILGGLVLIMLKAKVAVFINLGLQGGAFGRAPRLG